MSNFLAIWAPSVGTLALLWSFWRQSHPIARLRVKAEMRMADEPHSDEVNFTVANTGAVPVTLSGLAFVIYPNVFCRLSSISPHWHNLVQSEHPDIRLPKLLAAGEEWKGEAVLDDELLEEIAASRLYFKVYVSHRRPLVGRVRRENLLQLLRM